MKLDSISAAFHGRTDIEINLTVVQLVAAGCNAVYWLSGHNARRADLVSAVMAQSNGPTVQTTY
jgi:hypothetical protein